MGTGLLARAASRAAVRPARALVNRLAGGRPRVVRVLSGVARGARLELDLAGEKAYWLGHYEAPLQAWLRQNVRPGDLVFDVGAHIGFLTVCAGRLGCRVVAVEASPENARRARRNAELNVLPVDVVEAAAWSDDRGVTLVSGDSASEWRVAGSGDTPSVTLDALAERFGSPRLVKLDVEGAAGEALRGAAAIVANAATVFVVELHGAEEETAVRSLLAGYELAHVDVPTRLVARPGRGGARAASA